MPVNVVDPNPSAVPKVESPTIRTVTGLGVSRVVVSPRCSLPVLAAPRLITTSSSAAGERPCARRYGLSDGLLIQFAA